MTEWLLVFAFLIFALSIAAWMVVMERRHKSVLQRVLSKLMQKEPEDVNDHS